MVCLQWFPWHTRSLGVLARESHDEVALVLMLTLVPVQALVLVLARALVLRSVDQTKRMLWKEIYLPLPLSLPLTLFPHQSSL